MKHKTDFCKQSITLKFLLLTCAAMTGLCLNSHAATIDELLFDGTLCNFGTGDPDAAGVVPEFNGICSTYITGTQAEQKQLVKTLNPTQIFVMSDLSFALAKYQVNNVRKRIISLRLGRKGFIALGALDVNLYQPANSAEQWQTALQDAPLFSITSGSGGGGAGADVQLTSSRLGYFIGGNLGVGHKRLTTKEDAYHYNALGLTAGIDYRVAKYAIVGAALGFNSASLDIHGYNGNSGGDIDNSGYSLSLYSTAFTKVDFYIDTIVAYHSQGYKVARVVNFSTSLKPASEIAKSNPDSDTLTISAEMGYELFAIRGFTLLGLIRGEYYRNNFATISENGANTSLRISQFSSEELNTQIGAQFTYATRGFGGVVIPQLDVVWVDERIKDIASVDAQLINDPSQSGFITEANPRDLQYMRWGLGVTSILSAGKIIYLFFESTVNKDYVTNYNTSLGVRLEFH